MTIERSTAAVLSSTIQARKGSSRLERASELVAKELTLLEGEQLIHKTPALVKQQVSSLVYNNNSNYQYSSKTRDSSNNVLLHSSNDSLHQSNGIPSSESLLQHSSSAVSGVGSDAPAYEVPTIRLDASETAQHLVQTFESMADKKKSPVTKHIVQETLPTNRNTCN